MSDIQTIWNPLLQEGDFAVTGADLASGHDLTTAILTSFFTDRVAHADDTIPDQIAGQPADPRGWWGDIQPGGTLQPRGSRLWLLSRSKIITETIQDVQAYLEESVAWLIQDGIVGGIEIRVGTFPPRSRIGAVVTVIRNDGTRMDPLIFPSVWDNP